MTDHVINICRLGKGDKCCRYLVASAKGFECMKKTTIKETIDFKATSGNMVAISDNCDGYPAEKSLSILNESI